MKVWLNGDVGMNRSVVARQVLVVKWMKPWGSLVCSGSGGRVTLGSVLLKNNWFFSLLSLMLMKASKKVWVNK